MQVLDRASLDTLFDALGRRGLRVIGPTVADGAIVLSELADSADLPAGWTDEQDGGTYRLRRRDDDALFGYAVGPHSLKGHLLPPELRLLRARRDEAPVASRSSRRPPRRRASPSSACARATCTPWASRTGC